jgi:hypothetical protein
MAFLLLLDTYATHLLAQVLIHPSAWNKNSRKLAKNSSGIHRLGLVWQSQLI